MKDELMRVLFDFEHVPPIRFKLRLGKNVVEQISVRHLKHNFRFRTKIRMCQTLGIAPVFAARMLPKSWIHELNRAGGFALILKYQLYPWAHRALARRVKAELGLPVDGPRALEEGTMARFLRWHGERV